MVFKERASRFSYMARSRRQEVLWFASGDFKKLFNKEVHPPGRGSGANRLVNCMARLRLSRLSAIEMGAARRVFLLRLHR
jgi:hypothetical protein